MARKNDFKIELEQDAEKGVALLHLSGDLDAHTSKEMQVELDELAGKKQHKIIIDMAGVKYMSSAGASLLLNAQAKARENDGNVVLLNVGNRIQQVMELLGILTMFDLTNDRAIALSYF